MKIYKEIALLCFLSGIGSPAFAETVPGVAIFPTVYPTVSPTNYPTVEPIFYPTFSPTVHSTVLPTAAPTILPTPRAHCPPQFGAGVRAYNSQTQMLEPLDGTVHFIPEAYSLHLRIAEPPELLTDVQLRLEFVSRVDPAREAAITIPPSFMVRSGEEAAWEVVIPRTIPADIEQLNGGPLALRTRYHYTDEDNRPWLWLLPEGHSVLAIEIPGACTVRIPFWVSEDATPVPPPPAKRLFIPDILPESMDADLAGPGARVLDRLMITLDPADQSTLVEQIKAARDEVAAFLGKTLVIVGLDLESGRAVLEPLGGELTIEELLFTAYQFMDTVMFDLPVRLLDTDGNAPALPAAGEEYPRSFRIAEGALEPGRFARSDLFTDHRPVLAPWFMTTSAPAVRLAREQMYKGFGVPTVAVIDSGFGNGKTLIEHAELRWKPSSDPVRIGFERSNIFGIAKKRFNGFLGPEFSIKPKPGTDFHAVTQDRPERSHGTRVAQLIAADGIGEIAVDAENREKIGALPLPEVTTLGTAPLPTTRLAIVDILPDTPSGLPNASLLSLKSALLMMARDKPTYPIVNLSVSYECVPLRSRAIEALSEKQKEFFSRWDAACEKLLNEIRAQVRALTDTSERTVRREYLLVAAAGNDGISRRSLNKPETSARFTTLKKQLEGGLKDFLDRYETERPGMLTEEQRSTVLRRTLEDTTSLLAYFEKYRLVENNLFGKITPSRGEARGNLARDSASSSNVILVGSLSSPVQPKDKNDPTSVSYSWKEPIQRLEASSNTNDGVTSAKRILYAPGQNLLARGAQGKPLGFGSGTSYAAPLISGIATNLYRLSLDANGKESAMSKAHVIASILEHTADPLGGSFSDTGHGLVNAFKASLSLINGGLAVQKSRPAEVVRDSVPTQDLPSDAVRAIGFQIVLPHPYKVSWKTATGSGSFEDRFQPRTGDRAVDASFSWQARQRLAGDADDTHHYIAGHLRRAPLRDTENRLLPRLSLSGAELDGQSSCYETHFTVPVSTLKEITAIVFSSFPVAMDDKPYAVRAGDRENMFDWTKALADSGSIEFEKLRAAFDDFVVEVVHTDCEKLR